MTDETEIFQSRIPAEFLNSHKRMQWAYVMDENGAIQPEIAAEFGIDPQVEMHTILGTILRKLFPHEVNFVIEGYGAEYDAKTNELHEWLGKNCVGAWQHELRNSAERKNGATPIGIRFEADKDAVYFKMAWS